MNTFLKLKNWQLFWLIVFTYLAFQIVGTTTTAISSQGTTKEIPEYVFGVKAPTIFPWSNTIKKTAESSSVTSSSGTIMTFTKYSPIVILFILVLFGWFYAMGLNLNKKIPDTAKMYLRKFKWFMFIPIVYGFLLYIFVHFVLFKAVSNGETLNSSVIFASIVPFHLFSIFCIFYCIYFNAKSLKVAELQREVSFSDYVVEFFLLWFFPIGVWFIQPRINKIFDVTLQLKEQK